MTATPGGRVSDAEALAIYSGAAVVEDFAGTWPPDDDDDHPAGTWRPIGVLNEPGITVFTETLDETSTGGDWPAWAFADRLDYRAQVVIRARFAPRAFRWLRLYLDARPAEQLPKIHPPVKATGRHRDRILRARKDSHA